MGGQGYSYIYAPDIAPDGNKPERSSYDEVLLTARLEEAVRRINPKLPPAVLQAALKEVQRIHSPELLANNETFHRLLTEGVKVSYQKDGQDRGDLVWLIDFANPDNNEFVVANQFTVIENNQNKRPDVVLFVNGLPLVVIELKNAADENATIKSAYQQIETYKQTIPSLFTTNAFCDFRRTGGQGRFTVGGLFPLYGVEKCGWQNGSLALVSQLETLINGMLNKATLLDLIRHFMVFEKTKKEDPKTGVISISTVKKLAAYHQYYAVNAAVASTLRAADMGDGKDSGLASQQPRGDRKPGWSGTPRAAASRFPWCFIPARSCWQWITRPCW